MISLIIFIRKQIFKLIFPIYVSTMDLPLKFNADLVIDSFELFLVYPLFAY